ncbi:MAG: ATP-binding protein, partial [Armatimonadota bacterium]
VINARDAMPQGGVISVSLEARKVKNGVSNPLGLALAPGDYAVIHVDDTGPGVPSKLARHIFDPFVTTRRGEGHSGLGLSIVLQAVAAAGGLVDVKSRRPRGARFSVYLPLETERRDDPWADGEKVILLVEDEDDVRRFAEQVLLGEGYQVIAARSGEDALRIASQRAKPFDLALLDVSLPGMDGTALARLLRDQRLVRRIAFATAHAADLDRASATLKKPFGRDELIRFVAEAAGTYRNG